MADLRVAGAQLNLVVGDLEGNEARIADAMSWADEVEADILLLPELAVTGYPPEDLVLRPTFVQDNLDAVDRLAGRAGEAVTVVGFVDRAAGPARGADDAVPRSVANAAALLHQGAVRGRYHKILLPNYGVFDEDRYFACGAEPALLWDVAGVAIGLSICEDIWVPEGPPAEQAAAGAQILLNINASPYHYGKAQDREQMLRERAQAAGVPVVYLNLVGGQDELVFDGCSLVLDAGGHTLFRGPQFEEARFLVDVPVPPRRPDVPAMLIRPAPASRSRPEVPPAESWELPTSVEAEVYAALVTGLRDYVRKNEFGHVVVGLSGGIDSALTATIAADALGPDSVWGVSMPSRFSSEGSVVDSRKLAERLGIQFEVIPIDGAFTAHLDALARNFAGTSFGVAEENLQARIRGALLMAISNKHGGLVVATGNKSEMAVGYATLYGDMVGGYAVLKDVFKTLVYRLAKWRNQAGEVIPRAIIDKPPSAELRPDQLDTDSLPPYDLLDEILARYVEQDLSVEEILSQGFDASLVRRVAELVDRNEYKRRQAAPGVRITTKAFGKDRRLPITNRYRPGGGAH